MSDKFGKLNFQGFYFSNLQKLGFTIAFLWWVFSTKKVGFVMGHGCTFILLQHNARIFCKTNLCLLIGMVAQCKVYLAMATKILCILRTWQFSDGGFIGE